MFESDVRLEIRYFMQSRDYFLHCGVARPFAQAQHAHTGPGSAPLDRCERISGRQAQVIVAMKFQRKIGISAQAFENGAGAEWIKSACGISKTKALYPCL